MPRDESALVTLEQYARIQVALRREPAADLRSVLEQQGVDPEAWSDASERWKSALQRDAQHGDGELLLRWAEAKEAAEADGVDLDTPPESLNTLPMVSAPVVVQAVPTFLRPDAAKPLGVELRRLASAPSTPSAPSAPPAPIAASPWAGPSVLDVARPPPRAPAVRGGGTVEVDISQVVAGALPFAASEEPGAKPPLPRPAPPPAPPVARPTTAKPEQVMTLPIGFTVQPPENHLETLDGYAWLCAEVAAAPTRTTEIIGKYGLTEEGAWKALQRRWSLRLSADLELYQSWHQLFTKYKAAFERG